MGSFAEETADLAKPPSPQLLVLRAHQKKILHVIFTDVVYSYRLSIIILKKVK